MDDRYDGCEPCEMCYKAMRILTDAVVFCSINTIMNTATGYARLNITLPRDIAEYVRQNTTNISQYISEALRERVARERRERAFQAILSGPPSFTHIDDSTAYVRSLREEDKARDKRLGLL